jgi:hypothetical protein
MPVRAITPRVIAISGHVQFYRDLDYHDAANDDLVTGEDIFDPEEWPHRPLRLKPTRGSYSMRVRGVPQRVEPSPMHESADHGASMDGWSALSPSFSGQLGGGPAERTPAAARQRTPSSALPGARTPENRADRAGPRTARSQRNGASHGRANV